MPLWSLHRITNVIVLPIRSRQFPNEMRECERLVSFSVMCCLCTPEPDDEFSRGSTLIDFITF